MKYSLAIFFLMYHVFIDVSKKSSPYPRSSRFSPMSSSRSFIVLHFTFRSVIHLELILVNAWKFCLDSFSFLCMWMSSCSSTNCWKNCFFSTTLPLLLCQVSVDCICVSLFLGSLFCSIDLCFLFFHQHPLSWFYTFITTLEVT